MTHPDPSPFLGILMLDTRFERPLGDAGNVDSYPCPSRIEIVTGAESPDIVRDGRPTEALVDAFLSAARKLEREGAMAITSTCGFLITIQKDLASAVSIPVLSSALCLYPDLRARLGGGRIGILTASRRSLGSAALDAAGINPADVIIEGMEDCPAFHDAILAPKAEQKTSLDSAAIEAGLLAKAEALIAREPKLVGLLLECGNMPPYQAALAKATGLPVVSLIDGVVELLHELDHPH